MPKYRVLWDNGHACGLLADTFDTEEAALKAGEDWFREMCALDPDPAAAAEAYSYEAVEDEPTP